MAEKKKKKVSASRLSGLIEDIKVEHDIPVLERIRFPIVWERLPSGYRIQDLQPSKIENAVDIMKEYYIHEETLCKGVNLAEDPDGVEEYLSLVAYWLKDTQSLAVIEEGTGTVVGVLIGRVLDRTVMIQTRMTIMNTMSNLFGRTDDKRVIDQYKVCPFPACEQIESRPANAAKTAKGPKSKESSKTADTNKPNEKELMKSKSAAKLSRTSKYSSVVSSETKSDRVGVLGKMLEPMFDDEQTIVENPKLFSIHKLKSHLTGKVDILSLYDVDMYYSVYVILVVPQHRGKGIAKALLKCTLEMSKKFGCDVVAGIFTSKISQNIAYKEGFKVHEEMTLSDWLVLGQEVFTEIDGSDNTVAVMAHKIEVPEPPPPPLPQHPPRRSKSERSTKTTGR